MLDSLHLYIIHAWVHEFNPGYLYHPVPEAVEFLILDIQVTAVTLTWSPPRHPNGAILAYELLVEHDEPENTTALNMTATSYQLTGLDPQQNYTIQVRAYTSVGPGASRVVECTPLEIGKKYGCIMHVNCFLR